MPTTTSRRRNNYRRRTTASAKTNWPSGKGGHYKSTTKNYSAVRTDLQNKINSYRYLYSQCQLTGAFKPSPAIITKFSNMVNKGYMLHKVTGAKIAKWNHMTNPNYSTNWATKCLKSKFGVAIKGVFPTGNGRTYVVATSPTWKGKPFKFPNR